MYHHKMKKSHAFAIACLLLAACDGSLEKQVARYAGDGSADLLTRTYQPGVRSEGFQVELPPIPATESKRTFSLARLPLPERSAHFEIITFTPQTRGTIEELERQAPDIPPDHRINAVLFDAESREVFARIDARVADLDRTHTFRLVPAKFIRNIFDVDLSKISSSEHLVLSIDYAAGAVPRSNPVIVMIVVDAPTL